MAWSTLVAVSLVILFSGTSLKHSTSYEFANRYAGFYVFFPGQWSVSTFLTCYLNIVIFLCKPLSFLRTAFMSRVYLTRAPCSPIRGCKSLHQITNFQFARHSTHARAGRGTGIQVINTSRGNRERKPETGNSYTVE